MEEQKKNKADQRLKNLVKSKLEDIVFVDDLTGDETSVSIMDNRPYYQLSFYNQESKRA